MSNVAMKAHVEDVVALDKIRTDGGTQPRAALYQNVIDDYSEALLSGAIFPPVVLFYDGTDYWLADGFHRHGAHKQAGVGEIHADVRQGTRAAAKLYSAGANGRHGLRATNEDKRRAVTMLLTDPEVMNDPQTGAPWSDNKIAKLCTVSQPFVGSVRRSLITVISDDTQPRTYTTKHGTTAVMSTSNIGKPSAPQEPEVRPSSEPANLPAPDPLVADNDNEPHNHRAQGTGENEWYTPARYVDLAREVIGDFDVDPASNPIAQATVKARTYYTEETNGLNKEWNGKVWLNPPYAQPAISHFADKTVEEVRSGRCTEAIVLTHNYTDTGWFHTLAREADAICFTKGRIRFESPSGEKASPTQGQTFFYFGSNPDVFVDAFDEVVGFARRVN